MYPVMKSTVTIEVDVSELREKLTKAAQDAAKEAARKEAERVLDWSRRYLAYQSLMYRLSKLRDRP